MLPRLERVGADLGQAQHRLEPGVALLQRGEGELARAADEHHPPGDRDDVLGLLAVGQRGVRRVADDLGQGARAGHDDRVGVAPGGEDALALGRPDRDLLLDVLALVAALGRVGLLGRGLLGRGRGRGLAHRPRIGSLVGGPDRAPWPSWRAAATRDQARSFGAGAEDYDRVRPGYPAEVVRWALGPGRQQVVDVGAGTGKLTRVLLEEGHDVVAVEPDEQMRARLVAVSPGAVALAGTGEALPLPDASADAVLVAQAWHWMDRRAAAAEMARVVRPGGCAVLLWNVRDLDDPLAAAVRRAVVEHAPELAARAGVEGGPRPAEVPDARFSPDGATTADSSQRLGVADLLTLVSTWSYVALSPARDLVLDQVRREAEAAADGDGTVVVVQRTEVSRFRRA